MAHPRSRGEHGGQVAGKEFRRGSSPLTRGAPSLSTPGRVPKGLIPAHAGSTNPARPAGAFRRAHPRSRGEHNVTSSDMRAAVGSSPLTRGARVEKGLQKFALGLIPAHAGSTGTPSKQTRSSRAHPRSRGEHVRGRAGLFLPAGSSPLTRGAHLRQPRRSLAGGSSPLTRGALVWVKVFADGKRLIPAHAGSTRSRYMSASFPWAHPRSRGEHKSLAKSQ